MPYKHNETSIQISKLEIWFSNHLFARHENKVIMKSGNYIRFRKKKYQKESFEENNLSTAGWEKYVNGLKIHLMWMFYIK